MNNVVLIGRLTRDPELRYTAQTSNAMCTFTLAVDRNMSKDKRQEAEAKGQPTADFIRIVAWGKTAELCGNYLQKGLQTAVQGRIQTGSYTNKEGQRVYTTDVVADRVNFIEWPDTPRQNNSYQQGGFNQERPAGPGAFNQDIGSDDSGDDFIPFDDDSKIPF